MQIPGIPLKIYSLIEHMHSKDVWREGFLFLLSLVISSGQVGEVTDGRNGCETDCIRSEIVYLAGSL